MAQLVQVVRWPAVWQARVQISALHPRKVFPSEQTSNEEKGIDMKVKGQFHRGQKVSLTCEINSCLME